jgi:uncharacterized repeat protein (TIGR02543 family)
MSLKTFLKSKINRIITALTVVAVAGAGISVGTVVGNNEAQEADAVSTSTVYLKLNSSYWGQATAYYTFHCWGGSSGTTWPGFSIGSGSGSDLLSLSLDSAYQGFTGFTIVRWKEAAHTTEWNRAENSGFSSYSYNYFSNTAWGVVTNNAAYVVSFNGNEGTIGGSPTASQVIVSGGSFTSPGTMTRTGYTFNKWNTSSDGNGTDYTTSSAITSDVTLYAIWTQNVTQYTVSFDSQGGSSVSSQTINSGSTATEPTAPTYSGYRFLGWYTASSGGTAYSFSTAVTSSFTLYAHWIAQYTVTFNSNGGSVVASLTCDAGSSITKPSDPTKSNYSFKGWYTASSGGGQYSFPYTPTSSLTMYAQWTQTSFTITEHYMVNKVDTSSTRTETAGSTAFTPSTPGYSGVGTYTFDGWYTDSACTNAYTATTWTADGVLYGNYSVDVRLWTSANSWGDNGTAAHKFTYVSATNSYTIDYTFAAAEHFLAKAITNSSVSESCVWLRANSTGYTYFSSSYFSFQSSGDYHVISTYASEYVITLTAVPTAAWTGCTLKTSSVSVTEYRVKDGVKEDVAFNTESASNDAAFTPTTPSKVTGYNFIAWYTDVACTSSYSPTILTVATTLYAKFTAIPTYTVSEYAVYDGYNGTLTADTYAALSSTYSVLSLGSETATDGVSFTPTTPTAPSNYTITGGGWYTAPQCHTSQAYTATTLAADTKLFYKFVTNFGTSDHNEALYLGRGSQDSKNLNLPANHFIYDSTLQRYVLNSYTFGATDNFQFHDVTKMTESGTTWADTAWGGYLMSAFQNCTNISGSGAGSDLTVATAGASTSYDLAIMYEVESATSAYYGYWYMVKPTGTSHSGADIYLYGPFSNWTTDYKAYKFAYNATYDYYELTATFASGDSFAFHYAAKSTIDSGYGNYSAAVFGGKTGTPFTSDSNNRIYVNTSGAGTWHLTIKGTVIDATSDLAAYWSDCQSTSSTILYFPEFTVTNGTISGSRVGLESCVSGSTFTPTTPTYDSAAYSFDGWFSNADCTTAFTSGATQTAGITIYAKITTIAYKYIYFGMPENATNFSIDNLRVYMWGSGSTSPLGGFPGVKPSDNTLGVTCKQAYNSTSSAKILVPDPSATSSITYVLYKIGIPDSLITLAGNNIGIIVSWNNGTNYQSSDLSYVENGFYWRNDTVAGGNGGYSADFGLGAKLAFDTYTAITATKNVTNGNASVCGLSQSEASTLYTDYQALTGTALSLFNSCTMYQYTKQVSSPIWHGSQQNISLQDTMARVYLISTGNASGALRPGIGQTGSPISWTLIIVASTGTASLLSIIGIYLFSKKRRRHSLDHTA